LESNKFSDFLYMLLSTPWLW